MPRDTGSPRRPNATAHVPRLIPPQTRGHKTLRIFSTGTSNLNRGLKTASKHWRKASGSSSFESTPYQTDTYGYDSTRDYLTSASYGDGNPNATPSWTYDAAGNRNDATTDNLNRLTASTGSYTYENDILGNRTWRNRYSQTGGVKYEWDVLNRMTKLVGTSSGANYTYRADGMRTQKVEGFNLSWQWWDRAETSGYYDEVTATNLPTTRYFYDGQMAMEDDFTRLVSNVTTVDVTRYGLGARGIDRIEKTLDFYGTSPTTTVSYPVYDAHGNMVRTLSKNSGGYTVTSARIFGAWGEVRNSSGPSASKGRYVANLGHVQDDESGLIYMRARYYEPGLGRFVSEDPAWIGINWFAYADNNPVHKVDYSGKSAMVYLGVLLGFLQGLVEAISGMTGRDISVHSILMAVYDSAAGTAAGTVAGVVMEWLANNSILKDVLKRQGRVYAASIVGALAAWGMCKAGQYIGRLYLELFMMDFENQLNASGFNVDFGIDS